VFIERVATLCRCHAWDDMSLSVLSCVTWSDVELTKMHLNYANLTLGFHIMISCWMEKNLCCSCHGKYFINVFVITETRHVCELMLQHHQCYFFQYMILIVIHIYKFGYIYYNIYVYMHKVLGLLWYMGWTVYLLVWNMAFNPTSWK